MSPPLLFQPPRGPDKLLDLELVWPQPYRPDPIPLQVRSDRETKQTPTGPGNQTNAMTLVATHGRILWTKTHADLFSQQNYKATPFVFTADGPPAVRQRNVPFIFSNAVLLFISKTFAEFSSLITVYIYLT
jgi:hypothetical protein